MALGVVGPASGSTKATTTMAIVKHRNNKPLEQLRPFLRMIDFILISTKRRDKAFRGTLWL